MNDIEQLIVAILDIQIPEIHWLFYCLVPYFYGIKSKQGIGNFGTKGKKYRVFSLER